MSNALTSVSTVPDVDVERVDIDINVPDIDVECIDIEINRA